MKTAILAGNIKEYLEYLKHFGMSDNNYVYIDRPEKVMGLTLRDVIVIGTFWDRNDARELKELVETRIR